jgi:site-specific DNA recombinase
MTRRKTTTDSDGPKRIAAYCRVSTQRQAAEGDSVEAQQNNINRFIDFRKAVQGWVVESTCFYIDEGKSAKDKNRPQLQRLMRDIEAGHINVVICFKLDRITRSLQDFMDLWALFQKHEVQVVSMREEFDTSTPTGKAMLRLIMVSRES